MNDRAKVILKRGKAGPAIGRHPWVYSEFIESVLGSPKDGDTVEVYAEVDRPIGRGLFNSKSQIRIRLYAWEKSSEAAENNLSELNEDFWRHRISRALDLRNSLLRIKGPRRLIFSEADGLSGLTVDQFETNLVVQITSLALWTKRDLLLQILDDLLKPTRILLRSSKSMEKVEGFFEDNAWVKGSAPSEAIQIEEHEIRYGLDLSDSQKTGFYCDQRDNRKRARDFAEGRMALDLCCYTGAFALNLARGGAKKVIGVDSSAPAIERAKQNANLNGFSEICDFQEADVYDFLKAQSPHTFDLVVLDPPRLSPSRSAKEKALRSYFGMNEAALRVLSPGGIFISCSCSSSISIPDFASMLQAVARRAGRDLQFLEQRGAAGDHPVLASCPETQYLKCFFCKVD